MRLPTTTLLRLALLIATTLHSTCSSAHAASHASYVQAEPNTHHFKRISRRFEPCDWSQAIPLNSDPKSWTECQKRVDKGTRLLRAMEAPLPPANTSPGPGSSIYQSPGMLDDYGWDTDFQDPNSNINGLLTGIDEALAEFSISPEGKHWTVVVQNHGTNVPSDSDDADATYPRTHASYNNMVNFKDGVIIRYNNYGPDYRAARNRDLQGRVVPLKHWSDVFGLGLMALVDEGSATASGVRGIEHFFEYIITNDETKDVLEMIVGKDSVDWGTKEDKWPGHVFDISQPQAKAALATPNGNGITWLFAQRKKFLGVKAVDKVHIFDCGLAFWCMYFHLSEPGAGKSVEPAEAGKKDNV